MPRQTFLTEKTALGIAIFIAGLCSIVYELLISTTSAYFLGDSITQFSLTIGFYMAAMGLGSYLSKWFDEDHLAAWFITTEGLLGLVGGASVPLLYYFFTRLSPNAYQGLVIGLTVIIGTLTGFEIPLLARIMKKYYPLRVNLANVMSLDYFGALLATLLFPFLLLPFFGLFRSSVFFGLVNVALGVFVLYYFVGHLRRRLLRILLGVSLGISLAFAALLYFAHPLLEQWDSRAYPHRIIYREQTPYQQLTITKNRSDVRLHINRVIQFSSTDEYRYHEALGIVPLETARYAENKRLNPFKITVSTENGVVSLTGNVSDKKAYVKALRIARETSGVKDIDCENLNVRKVNTALTDTMITAKIEASVLKAKVFDEDSIPLAGINAETNNGIVTLKGELPDEAAASAIIKRASAVHGVKKIISRLQVKKAS